jgi:type I restriction enzyme, S subunit
MKLETFFEKFGLFADVPGAVEKVRELVLQLAVQGKLVPQDPNYEAADKLIGRIRAMRDAKKAI